MLHECSISRPSPTDPAQASPWPADTVASERFQEDGATLLRGVFDEWVEPLRAGLERNLRAPQDFAFSCESAPAGAPGRFFDSYRNWLLIPEYLDHVTHSCAASCDGIMEFLSVATCNFILTDERVGRELPFARQGANHR